MSTRCDTATDHIIPNCIVHLNVETAIIRMTFPNVVTNESKDPKSATRVNSKELFINENFLLTLKTKLHEMEWKTIFHIADTNITYEIFLKQIYFTSFMANALTKRMSLSKPNIFHIADTKVTYELFLKQIYFILCMANALTKRISQSKPSLK